MNRSSVTSFAFLLASVFFVVLGSSLRGQVTEPMPATTSVPELATRVIPIKRIEAGSRRDFCTMRLGTGDDKCLQATITCPTGWKQVCQGSCACGGTICQCVREEIAEAPNTCGNGICEPGEFTSDPQKIKRLIPICEQDCLALARSGTEQSVCFDERLAKCMGNSLDTARRAGCEREAEVSCGPAISTCDDLLIRQCVLRHIAVGKSIEGAEQTCRNDCTAIAERPRPIDLPVVTAPPAPAVTPPITPPMIEPKKEPLSPAAPTLGGCSATDFLQCIERERKAGRTQLDAQTRCNDFCKNIEGNRTYLDALRKKVETCDFANTGRCCEVAKQLGSSLTKTCIAVCAKKGVPDGTMALCK